MARPTLSPEIKDKKRIDILNSALEPFANNGYDQTTMGQIAEYAGISTGTLYLYFDSKFEVYTSLYSQALDVLRCSFETAMEEYATDVRHRIINLLESYRRFYKNNHSYYRILSSGFQGKTPQLSEIDEVTQKGVDILKFLEEPIKQGVKDGSLRPCDTFKTTASLWVMFDGVLMVAEKTYIRKLGKQYEDFYDRGIDIILSGILA